MSFDFDAPIDRHGTWSLRWERLAGRDIIPLWVADTDFRAPEAVIDALRRRVEHGIFGYTVAPGELREAIAARALRLYGWRIQPEWIVFLPGVVPGLHMAVRELSAPDEHVLLPEPIYQHFRRAVERAPRAYDAVALVLREGRWLLDEEQLVARLRSNSRLLLLCNPQNPGATVYTRVELERIASIAEHHDLVICSDEIHADLVLDPAASHVPIASLAREISRRCVTLMSPNKSFNLPGVGCAWAVIEDDHLRRRFSTELHATVHDPSLLGYVAALAAYRDGTPWLAAQIDYLRGNRDRVVAMVAATRGMTMARMQATYLAWIDVSRLALRDPDSHFLAHGVALSPGAQFGAPGFVRLNIGTQRRILEEALQRMARAASAAG
ncbi:MAG: PatB family C-S lyase [Betaproteobacteria bacterium]|nr:PatB family C-S lyase [Betaproteobacteria bacterium]